MPLSDALDHTDPSENIELFSQASEEIREAGDLDPLNRPPFEQNQSAHISSRIGNFRRGDFRLVILLALLLGVALPRGSHAQPEPGSVTVGFEVGHLGGATAKLYRPNAVAYSTLLTTDGDDFVALYLHRLWERPVSDSLLNVYYGPGLYGRGRQLDTAPTAQAGISAQVGLNFYDERFEVFLHATPLLRLRPFSSLRLTGSVGLRYDL